MRRTAVLAEKTWEAQGASQLLNHVDVAGYC